ncbi:MAG: hypothetical protein Q8K60_04325 [Parachlamydiaceae bacterium]|nr:hypothetical protein [Parachlamydiaceae bacterium]
MESENFSLVNNYNNYNDYNDNNDKLLKRFNELGNNNTERLQKLSEKLKDSDCSIITRKIIEAYWNHHTDNGQPVRIKTCVAACCCLPNFIEKISCVFISCFCCPLTTMISSKRQRKYDMDNEVQYQWDKIQEGWAEMDISALSFPVSILATLHPSVAESYVNKLVSYYLARIEVHEKHDRKFKINILAYDYYTKMRKDNWEKKLDPPDKKKIMFLYAEGYDHYESTLNEDRKNQSLSKVEKIIRDDTIDKFIKEKLMNKNVINYYNDSDEIQVEKEEKEEK